MSAEQNGSSVTQREFGRLIDDVDNLSNKVERLTDRIAATERHLVLLEKLDLKIEQLDHKIQRLTEKELPKLLVNNEYIKTKTKIIWAIVTFVVAAAVSLFIGTARAFFGI
jgi:predicted RNase H-like nuclease (RuvC/YqgF family)